MNFNGGGRRPGSSRPQSRRNPITGEEVPETRTPVREDHVERPASRPQSRPYSRPAEVPALQLGRLEDREKGPIPGYHHDYRCDTPATASTVSWGTPEPTERVGDYLYQSYSKPTQPAQQIKNATQISQEKPSDSKDQSQVNNAKPAKKYHSSDEEDHLGPTNTSGLQGGDSYQSLQKLEDGKRNQKLMETVMLDQLSRATISDPDQNTYPSTPPRHQPGMSRGQVRHLHESKVKTTGTFTEQLLAQRVRFGARVLTRNGHDALRELTGFFFAVDNSLTVYEYRQFGKSSKAMPFISRGCYCHLRGRRQGQQYTLVDIVPGNSLTFSTISQASLPATIQELGVATIRITDVDGDAKENILLDQVRPTEKKQTWANLHAPKSQREYSDQTILDQVQGFLRSKLKSRGIRTVTGLGKYFRQLDRSGDGTLDQDELKEALRQFRINIDEEKFHDLWDVLDQNDDGVLDYGEFMRGFIGEMNEFRKLLVRKAFQKLDSSKRGTVTHSNMCKFYNASKHPKVIAGESTESQVMDEFMGSFDHCLVKGEVTYVEFEEYYEGLSIGVESDSQFVNILKNTWGL